MHASAAVAADSFLSSFSSRVLWRLSRRSSQRGTETAFCSMPTSREAGGAEYCSLMQK